MEEMLKKAKEIIKKYNQEHLLYHIEKSSEEVKAKLIRQILSIDFEQINKLYEQIKEELKEDTHIIEPIEYTAKINLSEEELKRCKEVGAKAIKNEQLAVVTMAGGQGTRLRA